MAGKDIFKEITNEDIYTEIIEIKEANLKLLQSVKIHDRWLTGLTMGLVTVATAIITKIFPGG